MFKFKLFLISLVVTAGVLLAIIYFNRPKPVVALKLSQVADGLFITSQLQPGNMPTLKSRGFKHIVDLRPDGEAKGQASSAEIKAAAEQFDVDFHYIPVPHGEIPGSAVSALQSVLNARSSPTMLYCRSGNRAVRTFALVEASRTDGPSCDAIVKMVHDAGFAADDLKDNINERIAQRNSTEETKK